MRNLSDLRTGTASSKPHRFAGNSLFLVTLAFLISRPIIAFSQTVTDDTRGLKPLEYAERLQQQFAQKRPHAKAMTKALLTKAATKYVPTVNVSAPMTYGVDIGVTFWRLRPARTADPGDIQQRTRIAVRKRGRFEAPRMMMVPARVESETLFADGDLLKLTIEAPFEAYIYIINREQYEDGRYSEPYLIFPAAIDAGRNDKGFPGRLLFVPGDTADGNFELTTLAADGVPKVAEVFTIILSKEPLKELPLLEKSDEPRRIEKVLFARWQTELAGPVWRFERQGPAGASITSVERSAGATLGATLTDDDPYPQTVYHVANTSKNLLLFDISLTMRK